jgi:Xaa-Pro aminopeptidase
MEYERAQLSGIRVYRWKKEKKLFKRLKELLKSIDSISLTYSSTTVDIYKAIKKHFKKTDDITEECRKLRQIKSEEEIMIIRRSCSIASGILARCINNLKRFRTEEDVRRYLLSETAKKGCDIAFPPIVASGKSASMPHYEPRKIRLRKGFCVIDFGVIYKGYHSDITRTIYLGKPTKKEKNIYNLLLDTQATLIKEIRPGMRCSELYEKALALLGDYSRYFTHGLGHGIGLDIHEYPNIKPDSQETFQENMVFTVEPGIYLPGKFGMRIEDDILIRKNKTDVLTKR